MRSHSEGAPPLDREEGRFGPGDMSGELDGRMQNMGRWQWGLMHMSTVDNAHKNCFELFSRHSKLCVVSSVSLDFVFKVFPEVGFESTCGMNVFQ